MRSRSDASENPYKWLIENGGPAVRLRTAVELMKDPGELNLDELRADLFKSPMVKTWLGRIGKPSGTEIPETFFDACGKLWTLGLKLGMPALDEKMAPYRSWITEHTRPYGESLADYKAHMAQVHCVAALLLFGCEDPALKVVIKRWLETFYQTASLGHYEPCTAPGFYRDVPLNLRDKPVFKPGRFMILPEITHLYALSNLPSDMRNKSIRGKVDIILRYMLDSRFTEPHVAILRPEPNQAIVTGWGLELPGLHGFDLDTFPSHLLVQRVQLLISFTRARETAWFKAAIKHLDSFKSGKDRWILPKEYLRDTATEGSWTTGGLMGLEENRRSPKALEIESTFHMLKIKSKLDD